MHRKVRTILDKFITMEFTKLVKKRDQLRKEAIDVAAYLLKKKVLKKALYEFHGIIALGQFINLGILLVGNVSSIYNILVDMEGVSENITSRERIAGETSLTWANVEDDDDLGVEIEVANQKEIVKTPKEMEVIWEAETNTVEAKTDRDSRKTPKLSSPMVDIDSIFGDQPRRKHKKEKKEKKEKKKKKKSAIDDIFG